MADHAAAAASPGGDYYCLCAYDFANEGIAWVVTVLISADRWHGIIYREDNPDLVEALGSMS